MKSADIEVLQRLSVICVVLGLVCCDHEHWCDPHVNYQPHQSGACGSSLSDMLSMVCFLNGGYYYLDDFKRSTTKRGAETQDQDTSSLTSLEKLRDRLMSRRHALSFLVSKKSHTLQQNVVCECCYNSCSMRELKQYCNYDDGGMDYDLYLKKRLTQSSESQESSSVGD